MKVLAPVTVASWSMVELKVALCPRQDPDEDPVTWVNVTHRALREHWSLQSRTERNVLLNSTLLVKIKLSSPRQQHFSQSSPLSSSRAGWHQRIRRCLAHAQTIVFPDYKIQYDGSPDTKARDFFSFYLLHEEEKGNKKGEIRNLISSPRQKCSGQGWRKPLSCFAWGEGETCKMSAVKITGFNIYLFSTGKQLSQICHAPN